MIDEKLNVTLQQLIIIQDKGQSKMFGAANVL